MTPFTIIDAGDTRAIDRLLARGHQSDEALVRRVRQIVTGVRREGDPALDRFARRFDHVTGSLEVSPEEMRDAAARVPRDVRRAIRQASRHIARVARQQLPRGSRTTGAPGVV